MEPNPYERFRDAQLSLTDHLAIDRTILANERTALAYARTVLAMLVVGGTAIKLLDSGLMHAVGVGFVVAAVVIAGVGAVRFWRTRRTLATALERHTGERRHPLKHAEAQTAPPGSPPAEALR